MSDMYDRIEDILKQKNMSKRQLAINAGIPYQTIVSAFRRRSEGLSLEYKLKIADVLQVKISDLYGWDEDEKHIESIRTGVTLLELTKKSNPLVYDLLFRFDQLNESGKVKTISYVDGLLESSEYQQPKEE